MSDQGAAVTVTEGQLAFPETRVFFVTQSGKEILVIQPDGRLERGKDFRTDDEASVAFIACVEAVLHRKLWSDTAVGQGGEVAP